MSLTDEQLEERKALDELYAAVRCATEGGEAMPGRAPDYVLQALAVLRARGFLPEHLRRHPRLMRSMAGARDVVATAHRRVVELAEDNNAAPVVQPTPPLAVPRCGQCNPSRRLEDTEGNDAGPCLRCHPAARQRVPA